MASNGIVVVDDGKGHVMNRVIETQTVKGQAQATRSEAAHVFPVQRELGDHVNRFLLCTLVSESAKRIKASAGKMGESLPMTMIVRGVLNSYRVAARDKYGPLAESEFDIDGLRSLNAIILRDEIERHSREKVKNSETRSSHERRLHDDA